LYVPLTSNPHVTVTVISMSDFFFFFFSFLSFSFLSSFWSGVMSCHKFQLTSDTSLPFHFIFCSIVFWSRLFSCLCLSARLSDCPFVYSSILSICFCFCFVLNILQLTHCLVKYAWITSNLNDWNLKTDLVHLFVNGNGKSVFYICICDCNKFVIVSVKMKNRKTKKDLFYKKNSRNKTIMRQDRDRRNKNRWFGKNWNWNEKTFVLLFSVSNEPICKVDLTRRWKIAKPSNFQTTLKKFPFSK
jgi:hypothetical protein